MKSHGVIPFHSECKSISNESSPHVLLTRIISKTVPPLKISRANKRDVFPISVVIYLFQR